MKNFELYNPVKVIFGIGESSKLGTVAASLGRRALLVSYSEHGFLNSLLDTMRADLKANGVECIELYAIQANPLISAIRQGIDIARKEKVDLCIGVGGGSVMDSTKAIAAGVLYDGDPWNMFVSRHDREVAVPPERSLPTLMVPTLPATSSEMNCIAVATNDETHEKAYVMTPAIFPTVSVVDPALTATLPMYQTAVGTVDAMSHVLEAYLNGDQESPLQDRLHEGILVTLMSELRGVREEPQELKHRANLQWAITLSWNGYIQSGLEAPTPMHQMGHVLSARYNTTHGVTLAIFMDAYFRYTALLNEERSARFALLGEKIFGLSREGRSDVCVAKETVKRIVAFMDEFSVPHTLTAAGVPTEDITAIADDIVAHGCDAQGMLPSLPKIGRDGILTVLEMAKG